MPPATDSPSSFVPVCAIGASAGGVTALQTLFRLLPEDLGLAYVVVVHLSPDHPSALHEILSACTRMPVHQVRDGPPLLPNCVYVIAPDSELVIEGDDVKARPFTDPRGKRSPIDMFFRSVAAGRGDGIAVVLTGSGADGALGVRAIKESGGIVMVQEPAEAGFPSMPQNAIATGVADVVAPLARLADRIADAARSKEAVRSLDEDGAANDIRRIVSFLRTRTGHDFSGYKRSTVLRRIQRRMQVCQISTLADYALHLRANPEEARDLLSDLLISVTMFFRDPETYVALSHRVIRPLLEARSVAETEDELRAWVVGCATGEEAYSVAILLLEEAEQLKVNVPIQIFATDLDEGALATAREGRYPRSIETDVSAERLKRFFVDEGTHYRIDRRVRDLVLFATHSVVREPPFMRLDLITCRNVLIYLERSLQRHVNAIFRYALKADGYLFLGTAETADTSDNQFAVIDRDARIYRALPTRPDFVPTLSAPGPWVTGRPALTETRLATARLDVGEVLGESHAAALEASAPPSALVDAEHGVLHLSPTVGRFILLSAGPLSGRLPAIVRPELRLDLKLALDRAFEAQHPTITRPIDVAMEGDTRRVLLHITPLPTPEGAAARAMVYFLDSGPGQQEGEQHTMPPDELQHLHSELKVAQEAELAGRMRHESAVQELRASNEELQSLNEEYRSTAEELETSKEELQSINEELQTVNAELKSKLGIISAAHNDLQNLTASSEIGTLFLDADLRIRMFTPRVAELINVAEADVGRPITNFTHRLRYDDIASDVRRVLRDQQPIEAEVRTLDDRWFLVRIRPYRTVEGKVEGAVATFDDITRRKRDEQELAEELRSAVILQDLSAKLVTEDNIQTIYEDILTAAIEITQARAGTVQMLDPEANELVVLATRGFSPRTEAHFHRVDASSNTSCGVSLRTGERCYLNFDPASADPAIRMHVEDGVLSAQSSILVSRSGRPIGMVSTHWGEADHRLSDRELRFLDLLVRQAADLIEQRRAEAALRESELKYRTLFESMGQGYAELEMVRDAQGQAVDVRYLALNPSYERLTGIPVEQARGRAVTEVIPNFDSWWIEAYDRIVRSGQPGRLESSVATLGRWYEAHVYPQDGDRFTVFYEDVSDRRQAENVLRASEERQAFLLRLSDVLGPLADPDDIKLATTTELGRHLGASRVVFAEHVDDEHFEVGANYVDGSPDVVGRFRYRDYGADFLGELRSGRLRVQPNIARDSQLQEAERQGLQAAGVGAALQVPLLRHGRLVAFLAVNHAAAHEFSPKETALTREVAERAWAAVERARAEKALRDSEARLSGLGDASRDILWIRDADTLSWTYLTPAFEDIYGLSREEALQGDNFRNWLELIVPEDRDMARAMVQRVLAGEHLSFTYRIRRPHDGQVRWLRDTDFPILDAQGRVTSFGGIGQDVTELRAAEERLKTSEERLRSATEVAQFALWDWNMTTGDLAWSDEHYRMQGYAVGEVVPSYEAWAARIHPEDRAETEAALARARDTHSEYVHEFRSLHPDGSVHWLAGRGRFFYDEAGQPVRMIGAMLEVTERRDWEERQRVLVGELQHRTRNLMGVIQSMSERTALASSDLNDFRARFRDRLNALSRVQGLLSRLDEHDRVTFDELIRMELDALHDSRDQVTLSGPGGVRLRSSTVQTLAMALHELATNAVKYGALGQPAGRLAVQWSFEASGAGNKPWLHIDWRESGVSMPPAGAGPQGSGQGRELIEQALPYQLKARTQLAMTPDGVHCTISLPVSDSARASVPARH